MTRSGPPQSFSEVQRKLGPHVLNQLAVYVPEPVTSLHLNGMG